MFQVDLLFKLNNKMRFGWLVYAASFLAMMKHYINKNNNNKNNKIWLKQQLSELDWQIRVRTRMHLELLHTHKITYAQQMK